MATGVRGRAATLPPVSTVEQDKSRARATSSHSKQQPPLVPGSFASSGGRTPGLTPGYQDDPTKPEPAGYFAAATITRVATLPPGSAAAAGATSTPSRLYHFL
jgi:hypothetical protein